MTPCPWNYNDDGNSDDSVGCLNDGGGGGRDRMLIAGKVVWSIREAGIWASAAATAEALNK